MSWRALLRRALLCKVYGAWRIVYEREKRARNARETKAAHEVGLGTRRLF